MSLKPLAAAILAASLSGAATAAEDTAATATLKVLGFETAQKLAVAAARDCRAKGYQVAAAVVDRGGHLLALARYPHAGPHSVEVATRKAYTAMTFQAPTSQLTEMKALAFADKVMLVGGGVPVNVGGYIYGAVGVSGAPFEKVIGDLDEGCANAGIEAIRETLEFAE